MRRLVTSSILSAVLGLGLVPVVAAAPAAAVPATAHLAAAPEIPTMPATPNARATRAAPSTAAKISEPAALHAQAAPANATELLGADDASEAPAVIQGPCDGTIVFGETISCTIGVAGGSQSLTFPGTAGATIRLYIVKTSGTMTPYTEVRRPNNSAVCAATTSLDFDCALDTTGTHTIVVRDLSNTLTGTFSITIQNLSAPVGCGTVPFGETGATGALSATAELDCWQRASGQSGQRWRLRLVETSGTALIGMTLTRPDGTTLCGLTFATEITCTLDANGTYTVHLRDNSGTATSAYRLVVEKWPNPTGCATLTVGAAATSDGIVNAGEIACFTFSGTSSQTIRVRVTKTTGTWTPYTEVIRPDGTTVCAATTSADFNCVLTVNGTHTVIVRDLTGPATGNFTIKLDLV